MAMHILAFLAKIGRPSKLDEEMFLLKNAPKPRPVWRVLPWI